MEVGTLQSQTWENHSPSSVPLQNMLTHPHPCLIHPSSTCSTADGGVDLNSTLRRHTDLETNLIAGAMQQKLIFTEQDPLLPFLADYASGPFWNFCPKTSLKSKCPLVLVWCGVNMGVNQGAWTQSYKEGSLTHIRSAAAPRLIKQQHPNLHVCTSSEKQGLKLVGYKNA